MPATAHLLPFRRPAPPPAPDREALALPVRRFTVDGGAGLEEHLGRTCGKIAAGIRGLIPGRKLEAILLGGGYGRGEGGVLSTPAGDRPYNDLEFYVCIRGNRHLNERRFGRSLHVLGEILTPQAGVEVEFKITSRRELETAPVSMFSYDLLSGHRLLHGSPAILAGCTHHGDASRIPLSEATRLLMNRCSGLLFARERLERRELTAADADFVRRNMAKAELALGDALLVAHGSYHWSARERRRLLERLACSDRIGWLEEVRRRHATGVDFKLHPERSEAARETLQAEHTAVTALARKAWLWIEGRRLGTVFASAADYAHCATDKCPETDPSRNLLVNAKVLGPRALLEVNVRRHPRERVFNAMALLLWEPAALTSPRLLAQVQCELRTRATLFAEVIRAYRELWERVT
jgi:hypothetical protein